MRTLYYLLGEKLQQPSERWERWTFWFGVAAALVVAGVMTYAWWTASAV